MHIVELTAINMPGRRLWGINRSGQKVDLIVTGVPDGRPLWDITNAAVEAQFGVARGQGPLKRDLEEAEARGAPTVTWEQLQQAKTGGAFTIMLRPRMGRPPKNGVDTLTERVELRLTRLQLDMLQRNGGAPWIRDLLDRQVAEAT